MQVVFCYIVVIVIWSTTPLAITLSNDSLSPHAAIMLRMLLACVVVSLLVSIFQSNAVLKLRHWKVYVAGGFGVFPNMSLVYVAAEYIPSGLIAVVFSLNPIFAGFFAAKILKEPGFSVKKVVSIAVSITGLFIVFYSQISFDEHAWIGMVLILLSTCFFSLSQVMIKFFQKGSVINSMEQTLGTLCFALPGLVFAWYYFDGSSIFPVSGTSLAAVLYLAVIGSVCGFVAFYFILNKLSVAAVSIIPLLTPVLALFLGAYVLDEPMTYSILFGAGLVLLGLFLYGDSWAYMVGRIQRMVRM